MGFIKKLAVKSYTKELIAYINAVSKLNDDQVSQLLVCGVWLRSIMTVEKIIPTYETETSEFDPELNSYPITLRDIEHMIKLCGKKKLKFNEYALTIWVHTLRAILRPEINELAIELWKILMKNQKDFDRHLKMHKEEYIELGSSDEFINQTELYAKAILKVLPPKQLYRNSI